MTDKTLKPDWQLLARVRVDKSRRVQCQCRGCGQTVYADIHIIGWPDGEIACWGSRCFAREMGEKAKTAQAVYSGVSGRKLTDEERDLLDSNRKELIARFKKEEEEKSAAWKRHTEALIREANERKVKPIKPRVITHDLNDRPLTRKQPTSPGGPPVKFDERSHKFTITFYDQAGKLLKRLYRGSEQFCRNFIERELKNYPPGTRAELKVTKTGQIIYRATRS